jgi:hypothetical protein
MANTDQSKVELTALIDDEIDKVGNLAVFPDEPPSSGDWVDVHDVLAEPTDEELAEGKRLGKAIDVDDDDDTGVE